MLRHNFRTRKSATTNYLSVSPVESAEREGTIERRLLLQALLKLGVEVSIDYVLVQDRL